MKVAIVGLYPKDPDHLRGGVEAVTLRLSEGLARQPDMEVHIVVSESGREVGVTRTASGVTVHSIGGSRRFGNVLRSLPDRRRITRALREIAPDVVHAHSAHREALGAIASGFPTVVTIHGIIEHEIALETSRGKRLRGRFRKGLVETALRRMQNVILLSPAVADYYRPRLTHAKLWTIENPVDDLFFSLDETESPNTVLFSGVLIPRKGVRNLLRAFAIVRERICDARLRIAGPATIPDYETSIHETVRELALDDSVTFLGSLSPAELARECARASVYCLVSKQETLPVAIMEAMACARPVVASPVGGIPHLVRDDDTGFLVPYGDPVALADRLVRLLTDSELRDRLGTAARRIAEDRFTVESVCRRTIQVYREVVGDSRP